MNAFAVGPRRILLASVGSYGDVFPFLSLGKVLQRRGHDVTILTSGYFTEIVEKAGLKIAPVGTREQYESYVTNPNLINPFKGLRLTQKILESIIEPIYGYIQDEWLTPNSVIVASPYCMAPRIAQEVHNIPLLTINISPISLGSTCDPPTITPLISPMRLPQSFRRTFGRTMHWVTDQLIGNSVNKMRDKLGLKPIHKLMRWWHSPSGTISLFPEWFATASPDLPVNHQYAGFPATEKPNLGSERKEVDLEKFLAQKKPLLLFYPGSNASHLKRYFEVCSQVCAKLDYNGIMVAPVAKDLGPDFPEHMLVSSFVSMETTLPRVKAAVHHGGIGTIVDCLKAGVPQLMRPMFVDQPDNAVRVAKLGVGSWIAGSQFRVNNVTSKLKELLHSPAIVAQCREIQVRMRAENGLEIASDFIEKFANATYSAKRSAIL